MQAITFITAHFSDFDWTQRLVEQIRKTTPPALIQEILFIDQDRTETSRRRLQALDPQARVLQYPVSKRHFEWTRHDHAAVLNQAVYEAKGDYICLFDSDAHPVAADWIERCTELLQSNDAILAEDPSAPGLTHPCFMVLQRRHVALNLIFDADLFKNCTDTGRLIGEQLRCAGERVYLAPSTPAFGGKYGSWMLQDAVYHHGKGSFHGVQDELLKAQVHWKNAYFRQCVITARRYELTPVLQARYLMLKALHAARRQFQSRSRAAAL